MTKIISIANQKGGVGKTTTTYNLAYELTKLGKKVLTIDMDMQSNLTKLQGMLNDKDIKYSLSDLFSIIIDDKKLPDKKEFIKNSHGVDFIPSTKELVLTDSRLSVEMGTDQMLKILIDELKDDYDYILIDLAPTFNTLSINALTSSDEVIIPMKCELLSLTGLNDIVFQIDKVRKRLNRKLKIDGILLTMVDDRLTLTKVIKEQLSVMNESLKVYNTEIPKSTEVGKSELELKPISVFNFKHKVSKSYQEFAKEIIGERNNERI